MVGFWIKIKSQKLCNKCRIYCVNPTGRAQSGLSYEAAVERINKKRINSNNIELVLISKRYLNDNGQYNQLGSEIK